MNPIAYAHSLPGQPPEKWQPLEEHLKAVAEIARDFAAEFDSGDWAYNAGWLHDLGKAADAFQAYLRRENGLDDSEYDEVGHGRVNHSSAGAALAAEKLGLPGRLLAYLAAGHHAGLPDWHSADTGQAALSARLPEGRENLASICSYAEKLLSKLLLLSRPPPAIKHPKDYHLWIRMLFSCLVDADFLNTEVVMQPKQVGQRSGFLRISKLKDAFDRHMLEMTKTAPKTPVNTVRWEILTTCRAAADQPPGLFSLTVPTGGGKTLSGMAFALKHAIRHGKSRIIYVIPYTSIIEQTAQTLSEIFGPENVVEHHSNLDPERETQRTRLASENWDAPIIVTTNVQFFESLYAAKSSRCRKLHNIVNSVVILDEAQLLPPELLTPCVEVINQLTRNYGVTLLLSTATQPALPKLKKPREIISDPARLYERLKRTEISIPVSLLESSLWEDVAKNLQTHDQVLCIVNTRRDCYDLFKLMPEGTIHLSALMCGEHRSEVIKEIKQRLKYGQPTRVISTQLVEAGVDIDFPVVYRALAGLHSIAQAAGRCNREGRLNAEGRLGQVHVFVPPKPSPRGLLLKGESAMRQLCAMPGFDPQKPKEYTRYFELFYSMVNDTGSQFDNWLVKDVSPSLFVQFRTAGNNFKLIDDQAYHPVFVRFKHSDALLTQFRIVGPTRNLLRKLQRFTINLPASLVEKLQADGLLEEVFPGFLAQCNLSLYNKETGFDIYKNNLPVEDLIS